MAARWKDLRIAIKDGREILAISYIIPMKSCQYRPPFERLIRPVGLLLQVFAWDLKETQLETNYRKFSYFAASALGLSNNPTSDGRKKTRHKIRTDNS